jgi:hypothetical protein
MVFREAISLICGGHRMPRLRFAQRTAEQAPEWAEKIARKVY